MEPCKWTWRPHDDHDNVVDKTDTVIVTRDGVMYPDKNGNGMSSSSANGHNGHHNGHHHNGHSIKQVSISLLSREDGKQDIVNAAKSLGRKVKDGSLKAQDINLNSLGSHLRTNAGLGKNESLADPCVLVRLGGLASNMDYPPWQLRLTEMYSIPGLRDVTPDKLIRVLRQYGRCEQRLGK